MKMVFCDNRLGGLLGFRRDVIRHYVEEGHEVTLIAPKPQTDWDRVGYNVEGVSVKQINVKPHGVNPCSDMILFFTYLYLFLRIRPDVVFCYTIKPNIYGTIAARICGAKVICMMAGLGCVFFSQDRFAKIALVLYKFGLRFANKVILLNKMNYDYVIENNIVKNKQAVFFEGGEGLNLLEYKYLPMTFSAPCRFLMVSRMMYDKGYAEFVDAAKMIKEKYPECTFELLGPLDTSPTMVPEEQICEDERSGAVRYLGVSNDVLSVIGQDSTVIVLPSNYGEGLNRSLMEGCAIGRPVITTTIDGCKEIVDEGYNGYLVPPCDAVALARAMERFIHLPIEEKKQMSMNSHQRAVDLFDVNKVIEKYDSMAY